MLAGSTDTDALVRVTDGTAGRVADALVLTVDESETKSVCLSGDKTEGVMLPTGGGSAVGCAAVLFRTNSEPFVILCWSSGSFYAAPGPDVHPGRLATAT